MVTDCGQHTVIGSDSPTAGVVELNYYGDQVNWAWCRKCQGLAFAGNILPGACPAGASHDHSGSGNYVIAFTAAAAPAGQADWRWCRKCQGLAFARKPVAGPVPGRRARMTTPAAATTCWPRSDHGHIAPACGNLSLRLRQACICRAGPGST